MHPGPLDVLHEPRDEHLDTVADRVDIDLEPLQVGVDAHRPVVVDRGRDGQLADQVLLRRSRTRWRGRR